MDKSTETHIHIHIHEGVSPEAARAAASAAYGATVEELESDRVGEVPVTPEERKQFVERAYLESDGGAKPLLEFLADNPDRKISFPEISESLGYDSTRSLPGLLGSFGRRAKHRYNGVKPFSSDWEIDQWFLTMSKEDAESINALRD